jgi:uncharacterized protein with HEPN domain
VKDDKLYLIHIRESLEKIETYLRGHEREAFMSSSLIQDAVLRNLQTLAESTQRLPQTWKERHQEVDWKKISGFRNVLTHDYLGIDLARVWNILERDLPGLKRTIEEMLKEST